MKSIKNRTYQSVIYALLLCLVLLGCNEKDDKQPIKSGTITLSFKHTIDGANIVFDSNTYTNAAGNKYIITDIMYFISEIQLHKTNGEHIKLNASSDIYYIDQSIASTLTQNLLDKIPEGTFDSISFIFGFTPEKNKSFMFLNAPEVNMMWPTELGGGYHYIMINGKWLDTTATLQNFNLHLGIGQIYSESTSMNADSTNTNMMSTDRMNTDSITSFVHNHFRVSLPLTNFTIVDGTHKNIQLIMDINKWFNGTTPYNLNVWGGHIMQNQDAMHTLVLNGMKAFSAVNN